MGGKWLFNFIHFICLHKSAFKKQFNGLNFRAKGVTLKYGTGLKHIHATLLIKCNNITSINIDGVLHCWFCFTTYFSINTFIVELTIINSRGYYIGNRYMFGDNYSPATFRLNILCEFFKNILKSFVLFWVALNTVKIYSKRGNNV